MAIYQSETQLPTQLVANHIDAATAQQITTFLESNGVFKNYTGAPSNPSVLVDTPQAYPTDPYAAPITGADVLEISDASFTIGSGVQYPQVSAIIATNPGNDTIGVSDIAQDSTGFYGPHSYLIASGGGNDFINLLYANGSPAAGNDTILSGAGNDTIYAGSGYETIFSGTGDDSIAATINTGHIVINAGVASDTLGSDSVYLSGGFNTVNGGGGADFVTVVDGINVINSAALGDVIYGGTSSGNDTVNGGAGTDTIYTGAGNWSILSGSGGESINASGGGNITINGNATVNSTGGDNQISMVGGNADLFLTGSGNNTITTGAGNDTINGAGSTGNYVINEGSGLDSIYLGSGNWTVNSGGGTGNIDDVSSSKLTLNGSGDVTSEGGSDTITFGAGNHNFIAQHDTIPGSENNGSYDINVTGGNDTVNFDQVSNGAHVTISGSNDTSESFGAFLGAGSYSISGVGGSTVAGSSYYNIDTNLTSQSASISIDGSGSPGTYVEFHNVAQSDATIVTNGSTTTYTFGSGPNTLNVSLTDVSASQVKFDHH